MKKTFKILMALGAVAMLTACGGSGAGKSDKNQTATPDTPVTQENTDTSSYKRSVCVASQSYYDAQGVQVKVTCTNPENIDLYGETGNPAPYIQINELRVSLTGKYIVRNDNEKIIWDGIIIYPLPSDLKANGVVIFYAADEAGGYHRDSSKAFAIQTAPAPEPEPSPEPTPDPTPTPQQVCEDQGGFWDGTECFT